MDLIIFVIICILIINLFNKQKNIENFDNTLMNKIKTRIDAVANVRIQHIRNFVTKMKELSTKDATIEGNLNIMGSFNLLPKGSIIMFNSNVAPYGWALCDGGTYEEFVTPDLRGKFLRMWTDDSTKLEDFSGNIDYNVNWSGKNNNDRKYKILKHNINETAGSDLIALTSNEIPTHTHTLDEHSHSHSANNVKWWSRSWTYENGQPDSHPYYKNVKDNNEGVNLKMPDASSHTHTLTGLGGESFNNQPPYYVLTFIIRYK
jgi:microcystin-dependent protein